MKYFIIRLRWSQTDHETVIVKADTKEAAFDRLTNCNARYKEVVGSTGRIIE